MLAATVAAVAAALRTSACCNAQVAGQKAQTVVMPNSLSPVFNSHFEFYNVRLPDTLEVEVRLAPACVRRVRTPRLPPRRCGSG
jgi:hypothetical protein